MEARVAEIPVLTVRESTTRGALPDIVSRLTTYPFFVVLKGLKPTDDEEPVEDIVADIADISGRDGEVWPGKITFTRVRIDPDAASRASLGTRYSRTEQALSPHTDSAFSTRPHSLVAFQMVRSDPAGGWSTIVPVADVVAALDARHLDEMRRTQFAFGSEDMSILWGEPGRESMRYYRAQIEAASAKREVAPEQPIAVLDAIDRILAERESDRVFALDDGDVLMLNNWKALHGRTAMAPESARLMFRFRVNAAVLA